VEQQADGNWENEISFLFKVNKKGVQKNTLAIQNPD